MQSFFIGLSTFRVAYGVNFQRSIADADAIVYRHHQPDNIHVGSRIISANNFGAKLVELTLTSFLGFFCAKHRSNIVQVLRAAALFQVMLNKSAGHGRGALRTQYIVIIAAFESKHFFGDNIGKLADATRDKFGLLHDGRTYLLKIKFFRLLMDDAFQCLPFSYFVGQDIHHPYMRAKRRLRHEIISSVLKIIRSKDNGG